MEITTGMSHVHGEGGSMPVYMARPDGRGPYPAVIVVMEAFGLNQHMKKVADRFAAEGYVAAAPDLYYRDGSPVADYDNLPEAIRLMVGLHDDKILKDIDALVRQLQSDPMVQVDRIGITGFCMGGRVSFLTACNNKAIAAAAPFYGGGIGSVHQVSERTPKAPLDYAESLEAPVLLFYGGKDAFIPQTEVDAVRQRLQTLGKPAEVIVYEDADHGFFCDERPSYHPVSAADAWQRLLEFFKRHLKG